LAREAKLTPPFAIFLQLKVIFMALHSIDFKRLEVYEAGALLVTLLAYPGKSDHEEKRRSHVHTSLCACALRAIYEMDPDRAVSPQLIKPIYAFQTERNCSLGLRTLRRRLRHRMIAARMAYPFLKKAESGEVPKLPARIRRLSINAMAELVLDDAGHSDPENVETRIWRQSRPVIHLASAVHGLFAPSRGQNQAERPRSVNDQPPGYRICGSQCGVLRIPGCEERRITGRS
jgi:hypothetical protein